MRLSQLTTTPEHIENYSLVYRLMLLDQYRQIKTWQFVGYRCHKCDRVLKNDSTVPNHTVNCKKPIRKYKVEPKPETLFTTDGRPWVSIVDIECFDMNQVYQNDESINELPVNMEIGS